MLIITIFNEDARNDVFFKYWDNLRPQRVYQLPAAFSATWPSDLRMPQFEHVGSIFLCRETNLPTATIRFLQKIAISHACPSVIEGWGHCIDEGRRAAAVVVVLDGPPMNELVDSSNGVIVPASLGPPVQHLLPAKLCVWFPKNYYPPTCMTTVAEIGKALQRVLQMHSTERESLGAAAVSRSLRETDFFLGAIENIINNQVRGNNTCMYTYICVYVYTAFFIKVILE